jgi:hypothetical protein
MSSEISSNAKRLRTAGYYHLEKMEMPKIPPTIAGTTGCYNIEKFENPPDAKRLRTAGCHNFATLETPKIPRTILRTAGCHNFATLEMPKIDPPLNITMFLTKNSETLSLYYVALLMDMNIFPVDFYWPINHLKFDDFRLLKIICPAISITGSKVDTYDLYVSLCRFQFRSRLL